jgi:hypothetical protein
VLHLHTNAGIAVSAQKDGLLPLSQYATIALSSLGYHDYEGIALRDDEKPRLVNDLGQSAALILRNHGLLTAGATVATPSSGCTPCSAPARCRSWRRRDGAELVHVDPRIVGGVKANVAAVTKGLGGAIAWPALLRKLDRLDPSYKDLRLSQLLRPKAPPRLGASSLASPPSSSSEQSASPPAAQIDACPPLHPAWQ